MTTVDFATSMPSVLSSPTIRGELRLGWARDMSQIGSLTCLERVSQPGAVDSITGRSRRWARGGGFIAVAKRRLKLPSPSGSRRLIQVTGRCSSRPHRQQLIPLLVDEPSRQLPFQDQRCRLPRDQELLEAS